MCSYWFCVDLECGVRLKSHCLCLVFSEHRQASVPGPSGSVARLLYTVHFFLNFHFSFTIFVFQFTKSFFCSWSINTTTPCFLYIVTIVALNWWSDFFSRKHYSFHCKQWLEPLIYLHIHISLHKLSVMIRFCDWTHSKHYFQIGCVTCFNFLYLLKFSASQLAIF